ncbi:MAG: DUF3373 domain-containing protein, partial [Thiovulaceae bacterium]|nr:DUF3373 domain-containing protein [Sulfurimonadaceae bacterium]
KLQKKVGRVNAQAANDNVKFDVDFRTAYDNLEYKTAGGTTYKNDGLYSNRLWLNMGYAPTDELVFKGQLAYHKAFGNASMQTSGAMTNYPQRGTGFDTFDWVSSETLNDDKLRVREAYWLWMPKVGDLSFTASIGRRPSTNGYLANLRDDDPKAKSPLGHVINMEFDGASAGINLDTYVPGMMFKICLGRGLTNAKAWSNEADYTLFNGMGGTSPNYVEADGGMDTVDMYGFIFVPYDNGQYAVKTTWYRGLNVPGMILTNYQTQNTASMADDVQTWAMENTGDMDGMAVSFKVDGIGDGISDFLDETTFFASYAMSKSHPTDSAIRTAAVDTDNVGGAAALQMMGVASGNMLGSDKSETGSSYWLGVNMPNMTGGRFGLEYNHGDEYWRPFTYGEDTMAGSKLATRGDAIELYWTQPLIEKAFSMQVRYTQMTYDYTGSNGFFGDGGTPISMADAKASPYMDPVEEAQDIRVYFRYRY